MSSLCLFLGVVAAALSIDDALSSVNIGSTQDNNVGNVWLDWLLCSDADARGRSIAAGALRVSAPPRA